MNIDDKLNEATAQLAQSLTGRSVPDLEGHRSLARIVLPALAITAMVAVAAAVLLSANNDSEPVATPTTTIRSTTSAPSTTTTQAPTTTQTPPTTAVMSIPVSGPLFGEETGDALVFDNGSERVLTLDVDDRLGAMTHVDGQRAGDQPYRIHRVGDDLVVGWGSIYAYSIVTGQSRLIATATLFLPATEPDRIWIVDWANGGNIGTGAASAWQIDMDGNVLTKPAEIEGNEYPTIGIPGGLALETEHGIALWYPETGQSELVIGETYARILDTSGGLLAFCPTSACTDVEVADVLTGETLASVGTGTSGTGKFSPNGRYLAFDAGGDLFVAEFGISGRVAGATKGFADDGSPLNLAWAPDGTTVYAATSSYAMPSVSLARYNTVTQTSATAFLPVGATLDFVVLDRDEADLLLVDPFSL